MVYGLGSLNATDATTAMTCHLERRYYYHIQDIYFSELGFFGQYRVIIIWLNLAMKRVLDFLMSLALLLLLLLPLFVLALLVRFTSAGSALYWSDRVGKDNQIFRMPKFRSMRVDTPIVATHLLTDPNAYLTPIGSFLRTSSLDELPQLWCILKGDMSFVGPRPALYNQQDLIALRTERGISLLTPGLTGWAQVNGRDEIPIPQKVALDLEYLEQQSFAFDMKILLLTAQKVLNRDNVTH